MNKINDSKRRIDFYKASLGTHSFFLGGIFLILLFVALYFTREIVIPFVFALLFNFLLFPIVRSLKKIYIPAQISAAFVVLLLLLIISYGFYFFAEPAVTWINKGPDVLNKVDLKLTKIANIISKPMEVVSTLNQEISSLSAKANIQSNNIVAVKEFTYLSSVFITTWQFLLELGLIILLLYFLLISNNFFLHKITNWLATLDKEKEAMLIVNQMENQIWRYLFARTAINVFLAIAVSILMYIFEIPDPILWGVMTGLLEYIPYIGALVSTIIITFVALLTFNSLGLSFLVVFLFLILLFIEGNVIFPIVMGRTFTLNPVVILLSLIFWGWLWGIAGAFIAIPLMVSIKIIFENLYKVSFMYELLSDKPKQID